MPVEDLNGVHNHTELCQQGWERKRQHVAAVHSQEALGNLFMAYREELERMEVSSNWGNSSRMMLQTPRPYGQLWGKHGAGLGSHVWCGLKTLPPGCAGCFTRQLCRQISYTQVRLGVCLLQMLNNWWVFIFKPLGECLAFGRRRKPMGLDHTLVQRMCWQQPAYRQCPITWTCVGRPSRTSSLIDQSGNSVREGWGRRIHRSDLFGWIHLWAYWWHQYLVTRKNLYY